MTDHKAMYYMLFNAITDALDMIEKNEISLAAELLRQAQQLGEEMYCGTEL